MHGRQAYLIVCHEERRLSVGMTIKPERCHRTQQFRLVLALRSRLTILMVLGSARVATAAAAATGATSRRRRPGRRWWCCAATLGCRAALLLHSIALHCSWIVDSVVMALRRAKFELLPLCARAPGSPTGFVSVSKDKQRIPDAWQPNASGGEGSEWGRAKAGTAPCTPPLPLFPAPRTAILSPL